MNLFVAFLMWSPEEALWVSFSTHFSKLEQTKIIMDMEGTDFQSAFLKKLPQN